ncbi:MAG: class I SAM-dependent methyltransferase [Planctomycetaceae bacterium]|nr:class I SAM-dependent methyltransferase [Planctomycetaceae bacterium]
MTSIERISAVCDAVEYVIRNRIPGDVVECGVWRGGASMAAAKTCLRLGEVCRSLWLYDTFAGMSEPGACEDEQTHAKWRRLNQSDRNEWCCASLDDVKQNLMATGYPLDHMRFVVGKVEDTLPGCMPSQIAVLRLDTDWHDSTAWELKHLYPLLSPGGVLIIDDYGHWAGSRKAVDDYFRTHGLSPLLCRTDYTGRMCIKA